MGDFGLFLLLTRCDLKRKSCSKAVYPCSHASDKSPPLCSNTDATSDYLYEDPDAIGVTFH